MNAVAWVFLAAWLVTSLLIVVALAGDAALAAENRRLRRQLAQGRHPGLRVVGDDTGLATVPTSTDGGAA